MNLLAARGHKVLISTIREYIKTANPVSSRYLLSVYGFKMSSATLRSILASLEVDGYLTHPHTSAGRVPTDKGYRYYVQAISSNLSLGLEGRRRIIDFFTSRFQLEELFEKTSEFIAKITPFIGIVTRYYFRKLEIKHIDLISLKKGQLFLVLITKTGDLFKDRVLITKYDFDVQKIEEVLNKELVGLNFSSVNKKCRHLRTLGLFGNIFAEISDKLIQMVEQQEGSLYYSGVKNMFNFPEFSDSELLTSLMTLLEDNYLAFIETCSNLNENNARIAIGNEIKGLPLINTSLIAIPYYQNDQVAGTVGAIGPTRMDYEKIIAISECVAGNLTLSLQNKT